MTSTCVPFPLPPVRVTVVVVVVVVTVVTTSPVSSSRTSPVFLSTARLRPSSLLLSICCISRSREFSLLAYAESGCVVPLVSLLCLGWMVSCGWGGEPASFLLPSRLLRRCFLVAMVRVVDGGSQCAMSDDYYVIMKHLHLFDTITSSLQYIQCSSFRLPCG